MAFYYTHFEWVKKEILLQRAPVYPPPQDFSLCLPPPPTLTAPLPPFSLAETFERKRANSSGPIGVHNSRFHCNSCKVALQRWEIAERLPWCAHIASYYMLFTGKKTELLILWVKLTIFIRCLWSRAATALQRCHLTTSPRSASQLPGSFTRVDLDIVMKYCAAASPWCLMTGEAVEREEQSGQLITATASSRQREGVIWGELLGDRSLWVIFSLLVPPRNGPHLPVSRRLQQPTRGGEASSWLLLPEALSQERLIMSLRSCLS